MKALHTYIHIYIYKHSFIKTACLLFARCKSHFLTAFVFLTLSFAGSPWAATFTVNSTADTNDTMCATAPGGCTLREAINAANANPNRGLPDKILFAINPTDLANDCRVVEGANICRIIVTGASGLQNSNGETIYGLPAVREAVNIDGSIPENRSDVVGYPSITRPSIEIVGDTSENPVFPSAGLILVSKGSTVKGLIMHNFKTSPQNESGGECIEILGFQLNPGDEKAFDASNNTIIANYLATDASGRNPMPTNFDGVIVVDGSNNVIGGPTINDRNVILAARGRPAIRILSFGILKLLGILDETISAVDNIVQNNFVGFGVALEEVPSSNPNRNFDGIVAQSVAPSSAQATVSKENRVTGVQRIPVFSGSNSVNTQVIGNIVTKNLGVLGAIRINDNKGGLIKDNVVTENPTTGILIRLTSTNIAILNNSIFDNALLGIDLNNDGVTANDFNDEDSGPNNLQNFPVIDSVDPKSAVVFIQGHLNSKPNSLYKLQFYSNRAVDSSGNGEGESFIAELVVKTDSNGNVTFKVPANTIVGNFVDDGNGMTYITATATQFFCENDTNFDPGVCKPGSTSEFSAAVMVDLN